MSSVSVFPDGRIVSGSRDKTIRIWNLSFGESKCEAILEGHRGVNNIIKKIYYLI